MDHGTPDNSAGRRLPQPDDIDEHVARDPFFSRVLGPAYLDNPYDVLAELREREPVYRSCLGPWLISRHADVLTALRHPALIGDPTGTQLYEKYVGAVSEHGFGSQALSHMQFKDGPEHLRVRRHFAGYLNRRENKVAQQVWLEQITRTLLDEMSAQRGPIDLVASFASLLPARLFCRMLDLPEGEAPRLAAYARALVAADDPAFLLSERRRRVTTESSMDFSRYLGRELIKRKKAPGLDLLSWLLRGLEAKELEDFEELVINLIFFVVAGIKTTSDFLGNTVLALHRFPEQAAILRASDEPANLLLECFRLDSPIQQTPRFAKQSVMLGGAEVPAGAHLMLMIGSANRDPRVFERPDELLLLRDSTTAGVAFGGGEHHCVGSAMARREAAVAVPALLRRFPNLEVLDGATRMAGFTLRGFDYLPIDLHLRP